MTDVPKALSPSSQFGVGTSTLARGFTVGLGHRDVGVPWRGAASSRSAKIWW